MKNHPVSSEPIRHVLLPLQHITRRLSVRRIQPSGVLRLKESIERLGFLEQFPLIVMEGEHGTILLIDGNHRLEAALAAGLTCAPCLVKTNLTEQECYTLAMRSNSATETVVPSTLVTYTEFIKERSANYTQMQIADMLGWSREKVKDYGRLSQIAEEAWSVIGETFEASHHQPSGGTSPGHGETSPFTEWLLRSILDLSATQQLELVTELASDRITKGQFKHRAESYRVRNDMFSFAMQHFGNLGEPWTTRLSDALSSGAYDTDWKTTDHPKLQKLLDALQEEWEQKHSMHVIQGDFYEEVQKLGDACIDLILTDPPYNIARENIQVFAGRSNRSQDFGDWDKHDESEFLASFQIWARAWARILRPQGSGYVFTSDRSLSHLRDALVGAGLHVKATIVWHKTNPGTHAQAQPTNFTSSVEYVLFFTKGEGGHTFNWQGENEMHNHIETAICGGNERLVDGKGKTLHSTQKPERLIRHFLEISSNRGDTVFDGFAGTGTTGKVAKDSGRKFIGIEQDPTYFEAMQRRLAE